MADEENTEGKAAEAKTKARSGSGKNPLFALLLILNMAALGVVAFFQYDFMQKQANKPSLAQLLDEHEKSKLSPGAIDEIAKADDDKGMVMPLDGFTVNLAQGDGPKRFVRMNAVLKFSQDSKEAEFNARKPQIRDTIITILNSKRPEDLLKREGKSYLKEEIKSQINAFLINGKVEDVYYVGFQIN